MSCLKAYKNTVITSYFKIKDFSTTDSNDVKYRHNVQAYAVHFRINVYLVITGAF